MGEKVRINEKNDEGEGTEERMRIGVGYRK
jgi:hypothetical protein